MAKVTPRGVEATTLAEYLREVEQRWADALGPNMNTAPESPQGQLIGMEAEKLALLDAALIDIFSGLSLDTASGLQLDDFCTILGISRRAGTRTKTRVAINGNDGTVVPKGTRFVNDDGDVFVTTALGTTPNNIPFEAERVGATSVAGLKYETTPTWTASLVATSTYAGTAGESDSSFRSRARAVVNAKTTPRLALFEGELQQEFPEYALIKVEENTTGAAKAAYAWDVAGNNVIDFPDGSIFITVSQGPDTAEDLEEYLVRNGPFAVPKKVGRAAEVQRKVDITTRITGYFPGDGLAQIEKRIYDWWNGAWTDIPGGGVQIGAEPTADRLRAVANTIQGHDITSATVTDHVRPGTPVAQNIHTLARERVVARAIL